MDPRRRSSAPETLASYKGDGVKVGGSALAPGNHRSTAAEPGAQLRRPQLAKIDLIVVPPGADARIWMPPMRNSLADDRDFRKVR